MYGHIKGRITCKVPTHAWPYQKYELRGKCMQCQTKNTKYFVDTCIAKSKIQRPKIPWPGQRNQI